MTVTAELADGRTLEFPDGTAPEVVQATVKKVLGFDTTPGGAATGNPAMAAQGSAAQGPQPNTMADRAISIGGAGAMGTVMGAAAPELLSGAAGAAAAFPMTARIAPWLNSASVAARSAGRAAGAASGGISGLASEAAGQAVDAAGGGAAASEGARLLGGLAPELKTVAFMAARTAARGTGISAVLDLAKNELEKRVGRTATPDEQKALAQAITTLRSGDKSSEAANSLYGAMKDASVRERAVAGIDAERTLKIAQAEADRTTAAVLRGPVMEMQTAVKTLESTAQEALTVAQNSRSAIGVDRDSSSIGAELRAAILKRNQAQKLTMDKQYAADSAEVNKIVSAKESTGDLVENTPEYKALLTELDKKALASRAGRMASPLDTVGDSGLASSYSTLRRAISEKSVAVSESEYNAAASAGLKGHTGTNPQTGEPAWYRDFPTSFEALDNVRRKLGEVFRGNPPEGYAAITASDARKFYGQISDIQKSYAGGAGGPQERLLDNYAASKAELEPFISRRGRKSTALDRYDDNQFAADASALPRDLLRTPEGIKTAIELTGDRKLVLQAALDNSTSQLSGKDAAGVRSWMTANRSMLDAMPEVKLSVSKYADRLEQADKIAAHAASTAKIAAQRETYLMAEAEKTASNIKAEAEKKAERALKLGEKSSDALLGTKEGPENIRQLLEAGNARAWDIAGPAISASPTAKTNVIRAMRQVLADRAEKSTSNLTAFFEQNMRLGAERTGLMTKAEGDTISQQLQAIENFKLPERERLGLQKRLILQTVAGYASTLGARMIKNDKPLLGTGLLEQMIPQ